MPWEIPPGLAGQARAAGTGRRGNWHQNGYFVQVTTAIAQFMRELERLWDEHREASVARRDLAGALAHLAAEPSVWATVSFTHDRDMPWLLPGVAPTHRRAEVLTVAVVGFERRLIRSQRIHWDHAMLARQLGIPGPPSA